MKFKPTNLPKEEYRAVMREIDEAAIRAANIIRVGSISCYPIQSWEA